MALAASRIDRAADRGIRPGTRQAYNSFMITTPEQRDVIVERLAEIKADPKTNPETPKPQQVLEGEKLDQETTDLLRQLAEPPGADSPDNRNRLACPKCKSTELDFKGLRNNAESSGMPTTDPDAKVVSGTYSWQCKMCKHPFVVTIPNPNE